MSPTLSAWQKRICFYLVAFLITGCAVTERVKSDFAIDKAEQAYAAKDFATAAESYRRSAEAGGAYGQYMLSWMYAEGKGVKRDIAEAGRWMRKAADSGYPAANFTMGIRYLSGVGEKRNPQLGANHLLKAAEAEDDVAMFYLGVLNLYGTGVAVNPTEALRWFRMAKAHGYPVRPALLTEDGIAAQMKAKPRSISAGVTMKQEKKLLAKDIQSQLNRLGYRVGRPDGVVGAKTRIAIETFQRMQGMNVDGKPGYELLEALKRAK